MSTNEPPDDTTPDTWKSLSAKYADLAADCLRERKVTNLHLETISRRLGFAPRSYPYLLAAVAFLVGLRILDLFHRFAP